MKKSPYLSCIKNTNTMSSTTIAREFIPSKYQAAFFEWLENGTGNALINAVAGSGKTTTIIKGLERIDPSKKAYYLVFGKANAEEARNKVPAHVNVYTLHALGAASIRAAYGSRMNDKAVYNIVANMRENMYQNEGPIVDGDYLGRVRKLVDLYRVNLCNNYADLAAVAADHGLEIIGMEVENAMRAVAIKIADTDEHDFVDMLYRPAVDKACQLPAADYLFVDEVQDLNRAQQEMILKMMGKKTRVILVGDPRQAIFGFAGADSDSFDRLKSWPNMTELYLSYNYRCGSEIIDYVHTHIEGLTIEAHPGAWKGSVEEDDSIKNIEDGDMVICRNTLPLVKLCLHFIKMHRKAYVKGGDIGKQLANLVMRSKANTIDAFEKWIANELTVIFRRLQMSHPLLAAADIRKESAYVVMEEKRQVLEAIIDSADIRTPIDLIKWINDLFADERSGICLTTAHRAKGLENDRVFMIEIELMPSKRATTAKQMVQEINLMYVAFTRAKQHLGIIRDWHYNKR